MKKKECMVAILWLPESEHCYKYDIVLISWAIGIVATMNLITGTLTNSLQTICRQVDDMSSDEGSKDTFENRSSASEGDRSNQKGKRVMCLVKIDNEILTNSTVILLTLGQCSRRALSAAIDIYL